MTRITLNLCSELRERYPSCVNKLLEEASAEYIISLRTGDTMRTTTQRKTMFKRFFVFDVVIFQ